MHSYKHKATRPLIPSKEEAGMESQSDAAQKQQTDIPLNPVVTRGQDPELFWLEKYGKNGDADTLEVDVRSLYRHEHISPELLIRKLYRQSPLPFGGGAGAGVGQQMSLFAPDVRDLFGNALAMDEFEKVGEYYRHQGDWSNRLIQGDSLLVMSSLLEREGFAGKVQMIYLDPPYGIKYGSNWQLKLNERDVKDGADEHLSAEPEQIKAFRDTWELGIHSYLSYLRDRLLVARDLLTESGSCFVQISDENVHLVRCLMDEVFGSGNFVSLISVSKTTGASNDLLGTVNDYLVWYAKNKEQLKYRQLYHEKLVGEKGATGYTKVHLPDGTMRPLTPEESEDPELLPNGAKICATGDMTSQRPPGDFPVEFNGKIYRPVKSYWKTGIEGFKKLIEKNRIYATSGNRLAYIRYFDDFPVFPINNVWTDTVGQNQFGGDKVYVVQTGNKVLQRCLLMATDPGDLVLDPTCGSGTTAYVAEQWGRRWITIDTSRIAVNIAKTRLMTATFPYYHLASDVDVLVKEEKGKIKKSITPKTKSPGDSESPGDLGSDIRQGFVYEEVPHITLKSLANDEPPETETLYDRPYADKSRLRVAGPLTVETLQNDEPVTVDGGRHTVDGSIPGASGSFEERIFEHLKVSGVMNGAKQERAVFTRVEPLAHPYLHAEGFYPTAAGERKAYFHIGPQFGTVSKQAASEAAKECRSRGDADWLIILGFSFESDLSNQQYQTTKMGTFEATKVRMHDDLLQEGLTKKDRKAASFVTIGEPDVALMPYVGVMLRTQDEASGQGQSTHVASAGSFAGAQDDTHVQVIIQGLDIYDPIRDEVRARSVHDIAYWMLDDDYDGSNFIVRQVFFCGGDKDEFDKWKRGISDLSKQLAKANAQRMLRLELDDEAWERLYGFTSHPIPATPGRRIAVRVVSQFGEESMKVVGV
jgi:adenine-specific DNA-methyltransferase